MRKWLVVAGLTAAAVMGCNSPTAPKASSSSTPTTPTPPHHSATKPEYVLYAVPQQFQPSNGIPFSESVAKVIKNRSYGVRLRSDTSSDTTDTVPPPNSDSVFAEEPWNADSIVYAVGDSTGPCGPTTCAPTSWSLTLSTQVVNFAMDSAAVPGDTVTWVVDSDAYSWNPGDATPGLGLATSTSVTDSTGTATNTFTYNGPWQAGSSGPGGYGGYFYVEAKLKDTTGALVTHAKFYLIAWQLPVIQIIWDSTAMTAGVPYDVAQHISVYVEEGADTHIMPLSISWLELSPNGPVAGTVGQNDSATSIDPNCSVVGTVATCTNPGNTTINVWPATNGVPANTVNLVIPGCLGPDGVGCLTGYYTVPIDSTDGASPAAKRVSKAGVIRRRVR